MKKIQIVFQIQCVYRILIRIKDVFVKARIIGIQLIVVKIPPKKLFLIITLKLHKKFKSKNQTLTKHARNILKTNASPISSV